MINCSGIRLSRKGSAVTSPSNIIQCRHLLIGCLCPVVLTVIIIIVIISMTAATHNAIGQTVQNEKQFTQSYALNSLVITLMPDGQSKVQYDISVDPSKQETNVRLFGQTRNLTAQDISGNKSVETSLTESLENVTLVTLGVTNVKIQYNTPDLTQKNGRIWSFSLDSPLRFSVILPPNSVVIDWGKQNPILIQRSGEQNVITFDAGNVQLRYVTELPSSNNRADIVINYADTTIKDIKQRYPEIVLTDSERLLQNAILAKSNEKPGEAELFATRANDLSLETVKKYNTAQTIIGQAGAKLNKTSNQNDNDNSPSLTLLSQARELFSEGDYVRAIQFAQKAVSQQDLREPLSVSSNSSIPYTWQKMLVLFLVPILIIISVIGLVFIIIKRKELRSFAEHVKKISSNLFSKSRTKVVNEIASDELGQSSKISPGQYSSTQSKKCFPISLPSSLISSQQNIDQTVLFEAVTKFIEEKPQLKLEDRQVLSFLAQNQGAVFESEIRNRFKDLPKTTIWRLIKRLEREECIEIRKAVGQNLIRLRFGSEEGP